MKIYPIFYKLLLELYYNKNATPYEPVLEENYYISNRILKYVLDAREF